jgi:hypothetical protein
MGISVNLAGIKEAQGFEPIPADDYKLTIFEAEMVDVKSEPGQQQLKITFNVDGGEYDGRSIFGYYSWTNDKRLPFLKNLLHALGYDVEGEIDFDLYDDDETGTEGLVGKSLVAKVTYQKAKKDSGYSDSNQVSVCYPADEYEAE